VRFPDELPPTQIAYLDGRPATLRVRKCKLVYADRGKTYERVFDKDVIALGAMGDNDVILHDETVSRYHCTIRVDGDSYLVSDLESTNGTFVNRVRVREAYLKPGCTLALGNSEIRFEAVDEKVRLSPSEKTRFGELLGKSVRMREVFSILERIAPTDTTVIVEGETGTGKEVVARSLHAASRRAKGPMTVFDCGAVPANLIESELFGHEKGSFTGAIMTRQGVFELGSGGTVFLDEIGELPPDLQPKLLRVLEQREVRRVGAERPTKVDVRVVAATNRDLEEEVAAGRFRKDLYFRLSVVRIVLPPLRERPEDIPTLVKHFLRGHAARAEGGQRKVEAISREAMETLLAYSWPGNVRELGNVIERAISFCESDALEPDDLPDHVLSPRADGGSSPSSDMPFKEAKERWIGSFEREYVVQLLKKNDQNISKAAREADIDRKYFRKLMKKYGIKTVEGEEE
jgi:transcriptional regulator with GAF, ATPase, and Fis domain